jgi:hypothetical protein
MEKEQKRQTRRLAYSFFKKSRSRQEEISPKQIPKYLRG